MNIKHFCILIGCVFLNFTVTAQSIRINEIVSSNSSYIDEDEDTPDWIELHNFGTTSVSLLDWGLTDDGDNLHDWQFPDITIKPNEYLLVWASNKDIKELSYAKTLINQGDIHNYLLPSTEPSSNWKDLIFDDSTWNNGPSGFGFGDGDDATEIPMSGTSVYTRITFTMADLASLNKLIFDIDYDDGFVAYINGVEVARANINGAPPSYDATANEGHEANMHNGGKPDRFIIDNADSILIDGDNVLAIQLHNLSDTSSDLTLIPFLSAIFSNKSTVGINPPEILRLKDGKLHTNFKVSSSSSETILLSDASETVIDQITVENLPYDTSLGISRSSNTLVNYIDTTPNLINSDIEYLGAISSIVEFSHEGGSLDAAINLSLSGNSAGETIRYTTDSNVPTENDLAYITPITIDRNMVIRAKIFAPNHIPNKIHNKTFVFNKNHEIDMVFITVEYEDFFGEDRGIHHVNNYEKDWWERPVNFSFYEKESNAIPIEYNGGVKIFGGWSRNKPQRSLALIARSKYGDSEFEHPFFDQLDYDKFQGLVLRNSGGDFLYTNILDITLTSLMRGSGLDFQEHNPVATYINGEYWGMFNMREKVNEHFLVSKHGIDKKDITIIENEGYSAYGSTAEYRDLMNFVEEKDLSIDENFEYLTDRIDLMNYILYQASNMYFGNLDWPGWNIKYWKPTGGKWRWIMFDLDSTFGTEGSVPYINMFDFALEEDGPDWPNPPWSTILFRKLNENTEFINLFVNRYADELNTRFLPEKVLSHINQTIETVAPEIEAHFERWEGNLDTLRFSQNKMKDYAKLRPGFVKKHILEQYNFPGYHPITIQNNTISKGFVRVNNNLKIQENTWTGDYFQTVPIKLRAVAEPGYVFSHWSGAISSTQATISIDLENGMTVTPNFEQASIASVIINEINYKSGDVLDSDDWVELYNPNSTAIDISNWQLKDSNDTNVFNIPDGTLIEADAFIVLVKKEADFKVVFPNITNYVGNLGFGLGTTDAVRLFNANGILQDAVNYSSISPWPTCPNGTGQTLELITTELDNSLAENWNCITTNGSPDAFNKPLLSVDDNEHTKLKLFPNPVDSTLNLIGNGVSNLVSVKIINLAGQEIITIENPTDKINVEKLQKGFYFIKIQFENSELTHKFIKK